MFPYLALNPAVSISSLKQRGSASDPRFTLGDQFKIRRTYKSAASVALFCYSAQSRFAD